MRFAILAAGDGWHVRDLRRAAATLGHQAVAIDFRRLSAGVATGSGDAATRRRGDAATTDLPSIPASPRPPVAVSLEELAGFDGVLVRTMPPGSLEQVIFRMDALHRLQAAGVPVLNPARVVETCVDKYLAAARLEEAGLRVPPTVACQHADAALAAFHALGGDVVVKPLFGSEGRGMMRLADADLAWRTFRTLERLQNVLYVQRYIDHPGWDLRVFVLGGRVVAGMRRCAAGGWRTNVAQGGTAAAVHLTAEEEALALRAAAAVGAPVAGVDLLPGPAGEWYVLEVNAVPGWRALAPVTGIDIPVLLVRFLAEDYHRGQG